MGRRGQREGGRRVGGRGTEGKGGREGRRAGMWMSADPVAVSTRSVVGWLVQVCFGFAAAGGSGCGEAAGLQRSCCCLLLQHTCASRLL